MRFIIIVHCVCTLFRHNLIQQMNAWAAHTGAKIIINSHFHFWLMLRFNGDSIAWAPRMKVVLRASDCYDFILDVDPADGKGRLTVTCRKQFIFVSRQG